MNLKIPYIFAFFWILATGCTKHQSISTPTDVLNVGLDSKILAGDPRLIGGDANSQYIENLRFLSLIAFDQKANIEYVLAQNIEQTSPQSWVITLKPHVHFANGKDITAQDVVATYEQILNPQDGFPPSPRRGAFSNVKQISALSSQKVEIKLQKADASFLSNLVIGILPAQTALHAAPKDIDFKQNESGPFILTKKSDTQWILTRNQSFNLEKAPALREVHFHIIPDSGTRYAALMKGDIDLIQNSLDPDKINYIREKMPQEFTVKSAPKLATTYLGFNFRNPLMQNENIRQAIAYGIDVPSILNYRMHRHENQARGMFPENHNYDNPKLSPLLYNPVKAKELLSQSGLKLPIPISLKVSSTNKSLVEAAKAIAANLKIVGFQVRIDILENSVFQEQIKRGNAQMWISPWTGFKDPDHLRFVFSTDMAPPKGGNRGHYSNPIVDSLLAQGQEEFDPNKRKILYDKVQEHLAQDIPYVYLWHGTNDVVYRNSVHGFDIYPDGRYWSLIKVEKKNSP